MLKVLKDFFDTHLAPAAAAAEDEHTLALATAALFLEVARVDQGVSEGEQNAVIEALQSKFGLTGEEAKRLTELAQAEATQATDYYQFTQLINAQFAPERRIMIVELLWRIAYSDDRLDSYEEHFIRKIADLLYVSHSQFIATKLPARDAAR